MEQNLREKKTVDDFKAWALKLGCPVNALPSEAALNRLMKSNPASLQKLMDHIRPKSEVKLIRDNLLLQSITDSELLSERQLSNLPPNLEKFKKFQKLQRQISELKPRVEELKTTVNDKLLSTSKIGIFRSITSIYLLPNCCLS